MINVNLRAYPYDATNTKTFDTADQVKKAKMTTSSATEVKGIGKGNNKWWGGGSDIDNDDIRKDFNLLLPKILQLNKDIFSNKSVIKDLNFYLLQYQSTTTNEW